MSMSRFSAFSYTEMMVIYDALRKQEEDWEKYPNWKALQEYKTISTRLRDEINQYSPME